jgi:DNA-directed RNA polymerase subunit RPC12/RpoP
MQRVDRCINKYCRRPFYVIQKGGQMPGTKESEEITCPHCGHSKTERSNGVFDTSEMTAEDERQWLKDNGE